MALSFRSSSAHSRIVSPSMTVVTTTLTTRSSEQMDITETRAEKDGDGGHGPDNHDSIREVVAKAVTFEEAGAATEETERERRNP